VRVGRGATGVTLATLRLANPGLSGITSDVQVSSLTATVTDTAGVPVLHAASHLARLVARTATATYAVRAVQSEDGPALPLVLSPPLAVPVNAPVDLVLAADVADTARFGGFRIQVRPLSFEARDASSRDTVRVVFSADPLQGPPVLVEAPAVRVLVRGGALLPATVVAGQRDVSALRMVLTHAAPLGTARIELDSVAVTLRDEARAPLAPGIFLARLRLFVDGVETANLTGLPTTAGAVSIPLGG
jgi:hypothetical protein